MNTRTAADRAAAFAARLEKENPCQCGGKVEAEFNARYRVWVITCLKCKQVVKEYDE